MSDPTHVVRAAIFPPIGIARVGNSRVAGEKGFFIGPEVPEAPGLPEGGYKDATGALLRQAARFYIYGYNAEGEVVAELNAENAEIAWTVQLANKKAAWYEFQLALDIPEASAEGVPPSRRRNAIITGDDRKKLIIDPGARTIQGRGTSGVPYRFDTGKFFDLPVDLGELRTDEAGRLLVLGGFGLSQSVVGQPPSDFANNDGWHDDVSDGPVDAKVKIAGREIPVVGAWVAVGPPNYAPTLKTVRTMFDYLHDRMVVWNLEKAPMEVSFQKQIRPIFERLSGLQWVNLGFASWFGVDAPHEFHRLLERLGNPAPENKQFRQRLFEQFRNPAFSGRNLGKNLWPQLYGDALDSLVGKPGPDATFAVPAGLASLSSLQLGFLKKWADGDFTADGAKLAPSALAGAPLENRPGLLTEAALSFCLADAFHPGCELTWPMRIRWLYTGPYRIKRRSAGEPEPDYGEVMRPDVAVSPMGPLNGAGPGDLTRWMALPWQTDTASCLKGYSFFNTSPSLPTFWPARVPNDVLREDDFKILMDGKKSPAERRAAFFRRVDWFRGFIEPNDIEQMITDFHKLGVVELRAGPQDLPGLPHEVWVESKPNLPDPVPPAATIAPPHLTAAPRRYLLRKFGRGRQ